MFGFFPTARNVSYAQTNTHTHTQLVGRPGLHNTDLGWSFIHKTHSLGRLSMFPFFRGPFDAKCHPKDAILSVPRSVRVADSHHVLHWGHTPKM